MLNPNELILWQGETMCLESIIFYVLPSHLRLALLLLVLLEGTVPPKSTTLDKSGTVALWLTLLLPVSWQVCTYIQIYISLAHTYIHVYIFICQSDNPNDCNLITSRAIHVKAQGINLLPHHYDTCHYISYQGGGGS